MLEIKGKGSCKKASVKTAAMNQVNWDLPNQAGNAGGCPNPILHVVKRGKRSSLERW